MKVRVIVCDDHRIVREGLVALLEREPDLEVIAQARDGLELVRMARQLAPDVVVTDMSMPGMNGVEVTRRICSELPDCRVICLSVHDQTRQVLAALDAGASGYVLKDNSFDELARGIRCAMGKQLFLSVELIGTVLGARRQPEPVQQAAPAAELTPREREIVQMFSEGYSTQAIADSLHVSIKTVATHRERIYQKLRIQGVAELTRYALREGLSSLDAKLRCA